MKFLSAWEALAPEDRNESFTTKTQLWRWTGENCFLILILLLPRPQPRCWSRLLLLLPPSRCRFVSKTWSWSEVEVEQPTFFQNILCCLCLWRESDWEGGVGAGEHWCDGSERESVPACVRVREKECVRASERCSWESKRRTHQVASWQSRWSSTLRRCQKETSRSGFFCRSKQRWRKFESKRRFRPAVGPGSSQNGLSLLNSFL